MNEPTAELRTIDKMFAYLPHYGKIPCDLFYDVLDEIDKRIQALEAAAKPATAPVIKCPVCHLALYDDAAKAGYCADHEPKPTTPEEDGRPISGEWLLRIGFSFVRAAEPKSPGYVLSLYDLKPGDSAQGIFGEELRLVDGGESGKWHVEVRSRARSWGESVGIATFQTRGEVLRLLSALGLALRECGIVCKPTLIERLEALAKEWAGHEGLLSDVTTASECAGELRVLASHQDAAP